MMKANQEFRSLSEFSEDAKEIVGSLKLNGDAIIFTQNDNQTAAKKFLDAVL